MSVLRLSCTQLCILCGLIQCYPQQSCKPCSQNIMCFLYIVALGLTRKTWHEQGVIELSNDLHDCKHPWPNSFTKWNDQIIHNEAMTHSWWMFTQGNYVDFSLWLIFVIYLRLMLINASIWKYITKAAGSYKLGGIDVRKVVASIANTV